MYGCTAVWRVNLAETRPLLEAIDSELDLLLAPERNFREQVRLTTRRALRVLLRYYSGPCVARSSVRVAPSGRPELALPDAAVFSVTHTAGVALIALCETAPLGIDLEMQRPLKMSLARRTELAIAARDAGLDVAPALCEATTLSDESDRQVLEVWTQLEALAKAHGGGIGHILQSIGFRGRGGRNGTANVHDLIPEDGMITPLDPGRGYVAAMVHPRSHGLGRLHDFPASPDEIRKLCGSGRG